MAHSEDIPFMTGATVAPIVDNAVNKNQDEDLDDIINITEVKTSPVSNSISPFSFRHIDVSFSPVLKYNLVMEELQVVKKEREELRKSLAKCMEEKRSLELQLVSERNLKEEECKSSVSELEKLYISLNTQMYGMKCEVETWKRKAIGASKESSLLKEQLKSVELEKSEAVKKYADHVAQTESHDQFVKMFESYAKLQKDMILEMQKQYTDLLKAKENLNCILQSTQKQVEFMSLQLKAQDKDLKESKAYGQDLQTELIKAREMMKIKSSDKQ